jgi:hypothetical protein
MCYGIERDPYITGEGWDDCEPESPQYRFTFSDGSTIILCDDDEPQVKVPRKRIKPYLAEEVRDLAEQNEWMDADIINYIKSNYNDN